MKRIAGTISLVIFLRTVVGMGSRLQCELGDCENDVSHLFGQRNTNI